MRPKFEIVGGIHDIEPIAIGHSIRDLRRLLRRYGRGRWRKLKGFATIRTSDGILRKAELHWYEAHGIGRREVEVKRFFDLRFSDEEKLE